MNITNKKTGHFAYSPSVNIIRDGEKLLNYIPTPNAKLVFNQIVRDYGLGIRSFNIVGAYGTGKSSFIWALEKNLKRDTDFFSDIKNQLHDVESYEFYSFVGEYNSIIDSFASQFGLDVERNAKPQDIIHQIDNFYNDLTKQNKGLVIIIDEFGKYLEYVAKHDPDYELYFMQQLAEYVNDTKREILLLTVLHQDFNAYSLQLSKSQRFEWDKVKGRLKELTFNEPVEQLLFLASEQLSCKSHSKQRKLFQQNKMGNSPFSRLFGAIEKANAFPLRDYFSVEFAEKLLPFDILSASVLTLALQRYGQNERSLFSFMKSNDYLGLRDFSFNTQHYYNISNVYDYLIHNYHSLLTTKYNPHYAQWAAIRSAIERSEVIDKISYADATKMLKTIGLLNIFASDSAKLNKKFLSLYGKYSLGINNPEQLIESLEHFKIIRYKNHSNKYNIFGGTDLDIDLAIDEAGNLVEQVSDVVYHLNNCFEFPYIPAKAVFYKKGSPRFFQFKLSDDPIRNTPQGEIDGYINLIFSGRLNRNDIKKQSAKCNEAILYGWYQNTSEIKNLIYEIEKIKKVRELHLDDKVAIRELDSIIRHQVKLLNHCVLDSLYTENSPIVWYFQGKKVKITNLKSFNRQLSHICDTVYNTTPIFKSELVNKTNISGAISNARKNLLERLLNQWHEEHLGFEDGKFPPEKTIYLSLLYATGIHLKSKNGYLLTAPHDDSSFQPLWKLCIRFLDSSKVNRRNLDELVQLLSSKPFKLKKGFLDYWLSIFLCIKQEDYALFGPHGYIPSLSVDILELLIRKPKDYAVKAFNLNDIKLDLFNRYRALIDQAGEENPSNNSFIQTIKPFLVFYRELPEYSRTTKRLSKHALSLRNAIVQSQNPEKTFFEDFPSALGYSMLQLQNKRQQLEQYVKELQDSIRDLRTCYENLINRVEHFLLDEIVGTDLPFPAYKAVLQNRYKGLKKHLLLQRQKAFFQRLVSPLDDRNAWISSISQIVVGKSLDQITDEEEGQFFEKLRELIRELDNLCEICKEDVDVEKEDVFKLEVTDLAEGLQKFFIRLPKKKTKKMALLETEIKDKLVNDKSVNIHILAKILQEQLRNG